MLAATFVLLCALTWAKCPVVELSDGSVVYPTGGTTGFCRYLGIPFANPPVDALRFQQPVDFQGKPGSRVDLGKQPPPCPQNGLYGGRPIPPISEDCLYLNVFVPENSTTDSPSEGLAASDSPSDSPSEGLAASDSLSEGLAASDSPVLVWLYGGGFTNGDISWPVFQGDFFANRTQTVVVTVSYRLGAFGWLPLSDELTNFGLNDQRSGLRWVQRNIGRFGGSGEDVTVFGQSAGAISIGAHLVSEKSRGLFKRAIMESNAYAFFFRKVADSRTYVDEFMLEAGCDSVECLRTVPMETLLAVQKDTIGIPLPWEPEQAWPWGPSLVPGDLPDQPLRLLDKGVQVNAEQVMLGTTRNEGVAFTYGIWPLPLPGFAYEAAMLAFLESPDRLERLNELYPVHGLIADARPVMSEIVTDFVFGCASRRAADLLSARGTPTYLYNFMHHPDSGSTLHHPQCNVSGIVCHASEIYLVWRTAYLADYHYGPGELALADMLNDLWATFARTGKTGSIPWPLYNSTTKPSLAINLDSRIYHAYRNDRCNFWDEQHVY